MRRCLVLLCLILPLAACQLSLPGRGAGADADGAAVPLADGPVMGGTVTTTTLDAPPVVAAAAGAAAVGAVAVPAAGDGPRPRARPVAAGAAVDVVPVAEAEAAPPAPAPKSQAQIACEKTKGIWSGTGSGAMACVRPTRDSGKSCDSKGDCEGECLARSRSCAPITPMFGCNAVLMDTGAEVTLCID